MKIIFLDHQGVMFLQTHPNPGVLKNFDRNAVLILNDILNITNAELVISSDWKTWVSLDEMRRFYQEQGIKPPLDYTPIGIQGLGLEKGRASEILTWLGNHPEVTQWVAIDDLDLSRDLKHFVQTTAQEGITKQVVAQMVVKILGE